MANNNGCGGRGRRNSNSSYGCLNNLGGRWRWDNFPYYGGPCPDADGVYDCDRSDGGDSGCGCDGERSCRRQRRRGCYGLFTAMLPMAISPNGIIPLVSSNCLCNGDSFPCSCGLISIEEEGTYLATYTVRVPTGATVESTLSLNVNDACQSSAITEVGGQGPVGFTGQAMFDVRDRATLSLRSSEAINLTDPSTQPLVTLSLMKIQ